MSRIYPWSAVVGQPLLKRALLLCAIDPGIGGVLIRGPRGIAKTTLARALAELVPGRFVELPLGASEERVTGTLDLDAALRESRVAFAPGLLARAHDGVLYVDEVNLLPDSLVDLLLDAAASGQHTVERDAISHTHAARFVLIGTMNPDEGELRPQLVDRFGLSASAGAQISGAERAQIVTRRLAFDRDPGAFRAAYRAEQEQLAQRCARARERAEKIEATEACVGWVTERCAAAAVEGVRADLAMLRAARAHAAWHEREEILQEDVEAVAELALAHRRRAERPPEPPASRKESSAARAEGSGDRWKESAKNERDGDWGARPALPVPIEPRSAAELAHSLLPVQRTSPEARRRGRAALDHAGRRHTPRVAAQGSIDWFATLARRPRPQRSDLRYRARRAPRRELWIVALDCSSSMLRAGALAAAKGVAAAVDAEAQRRGAHVALLSFRGADARVDVPASAARGALPRALHEIGGGGGTPLRRALLGALALCRQPRWQSPQVTKRFVLLTDGRSRDRIEPLAAALAEHGVTALVIDCERSAARLGRAPALAAALGARCLHVDAL